MASIQPNTHSFIVKVWLVETNDKTVGRTWRGRIIHVPSGQFRYFTNLNEVSGFMTPYLHQLGVQPTLFWKIRHWLRR